MKKTTYILVAVVVLVILVAIAGFFFYREYSEKLNVAKDGEGVVNSALFKCADNKSIQAIFFKDRVELTLSDGRNMLLPQAVSASGARYANTDESFVFWNKGDTAFVTEGNATTFADCTVASPTTDAGNSNQIANPASVNCTEKGGTSTIETRGDGSQYGLCYFDDNRACEEWAMLQGNCPVGGVKTTGFDTIDQKFCAWSGGQTLAVPNSVCTLKDGTKCSTLDFYNGDCPVYK